MGDPSGTHGIKAAQCICYTALRAEPDWAGAFLVPESEVRKELGEHWAWLERVMRSEKGLWPRHGGMER